MIKKCKNLALLGLFVFIGQVTFGKNNLGHVQKGHVFDLAALKKQLLNLELEKQRFRAELMKQRYNAVVCEDIQLLALFNKIKKDLGISDTVPLFVSPKHKRAYAFYVPGLEVVCICAKKFYACSELFKMHILAHELRHHLQFTAKTDVNISQQLEMYQQQGFTWDQALERDADRFGIEYACKNCPLCIKELRRSFGCYQLCAFLKDKKGYFDWAAFQELLGQVNKKPVFCARHVCGAGVRQFYIYECLHQAKPIAFALLGAMIGQCIGVAADKALAC